MRKNKFGYFFWLFLILVVSFFCIAILEWFKNTFGVTFTEIIYTIRSPLQGADTHFLHGAIISCVPYFFIVLIFMFIAYVILKLKEIMSVKIEIGSRRTIKFDILAIMQIMLFIFPFICLSRTIVNLNSTLRITDFVKSRMNMSTIYEEYYVFPTDEHISSADNKNLILIYMESMETTYASEEVGGKQPIHNYIPNLTSLAEDNISFSNTDKLGGFHCEPNAGWTVAAIFTCESGFPFVFPLSANEDFDNRKAFAKKTVMLGDVLEKKGYYQEFICGSDSSFAGKKTMFKQHGNYNIYDLESAIEDGYLEEDDVVWWGYEDSMLYRIAKDELDRISNIGKPFNVTMLTVDTHHVDGYVCELCENEYDEQLANVIKCADRQIVDFINWCKQQPWYEDTVIVIMGDHPRMDTSLVDGVRYYDRTVYNCFINTGYNKNQISSSNRVFTSHDMFPTILGAMGYDITGDRLGLGTNLFSCKETLSEELGADYVETEVQKSSAFYEKNFY